MSNFVVFWLFILATLCYAAAQVADSRGRSGFLHGAIAAGLGLLSMFVIPFFGLGAPVYLIAQFLTPHAKLPCPKCGVRLDHSTKICPHCQHKLSS